MKLIVNNFLYMIILIFIFVTGCGQSDILSKMKKQIPIFEGAQVIDSYMPEEKMGVIKMEIQVSKASQKEILEFYKDTMISKGWELKKLKDYGKNGSVMELTNKDLSMLSVMTIMKKVQDTGKIPVTLNLTIK